MLKGSRKYWILAVICGILASGLCYLYIEDVKRQYRPDDLMTVIKARTDLQRDSVVTEEMLETVELPGKYVHPDAVQNRKDIVGQIVGSDISAGEIILKQKLVDKNSATDRMAYKVPDSKRAVAIGINSISGVAGYIRAGDYVDVFATLDIDTGVGSGQEETFTVLTLQDIEVLAVGSSSDQSEGSEGGKTITLAVDPQQASALILASERGAVRLALRSPVDHNLTTVPPLQLPGLVNPPPQP
jgi:pilus assembly protein CpaB